MAWIFLMIAGVFEIFWAAFLKMSNGFTRPVYSICTILGMIISFYFLAQATKTLPISTGYAIWTGIGAVGAAVTGVMIFKETMTLNHVFFLTLLLAGIVGLKFTSAH